MASPAAVGMPISLAKLFTGTNCVYGLCENMCIIYYEHILAQGHIR